MKSVTILTPPPPPPLAPALAVFCFPSKPNIPEGPDYEKYQHLKITNSTPQFVLENHAHSLFLTISLVDKLPTSVKYT